MFWEMLRMLPVGGTLQGFQHCVDQEHPGQHSEGARSALTASLGAPAFNTYPASRVSRD